MEMMLSTHTSMSTKSQMRFRSPRNSSWALKQNSVAAAAKIAVLKRITLGNRLVERFNVVLLWRPEKGLIIKPHLTFHRRDGE